MLMKLKKMNLGDITALFTLREKLLNAKPTSFGDAIKQAIKNNDLQGALSMISEQLTAGNRESVEWCVGVSTLNIIDTLALKPNT